MIENRQQSSIFLEPMLETSIDLITNISGKLLIDNNGNYLNDRVSGEKQIYRVDSFVGNGLLLYTSNAWSIITGDYNIGNQTGMENYYNTFTIPDDEIVNYKINAYLETIDSFDGNSTALASPYNYSLYTVYKVILNGKYVTDWYSSGNIINFNTGYKPFGNDLVVVYYKKDQTITTEACKLYFKSVIKSIPSSLDFEGIKLTGTVSSHSINKLMLVGNSTLFKTELKKDYMIRVGENKYKVVKVLGDTIIIVDKVVEDLINYDIYVTPAYNLLSVDTDLSINPSSTFYSKNIIGSKLGTRKYLSTNNTTVLTKWIDNNLENFEWYNYPVMHDRVQNYINTSSLFRICFINKATTEMTMLINARLSEKPSLAFNTDKNIENLNIEFEDKITILNYDKLFGNTDIYGEGYFGGIKILKDSEVK